MAMPTAEQQRRARIFGWLFAGTFVTSIPAGLIFYDPVLNDADFILGGGFDASVTVGAFLEVLLALTNIGTAVVLYPIVRRQSETLALGYVASRIVESTVIVVGLISVMSIVSLREDLGAGTDPGTLTVAGQSLVALHDYTFLLGPGFCVGVNGILLGYLFYKSGLVPRWIAMFGLVGGPLIFVSAIAVLFGVYEQDGLHALFSLPEAIFEAAITIYTIWKGFRPSPILDDARYPQVGQRPGTAAMGAA